MKKELNSNDAAVISVRDLRFGYADETVISIDAFELDAARSVAVIGPSGCGKTTFLHLLAGLLTPTAGEVRVLDQALSQFSASEMDRFRGQYMGLVFQKLFLMPALTVSENLNLALRLARRPANDERIRYVLNQLDVFELARRLPQELSVGQAQRVAIARALVHEPALVLADEPTSALDDARAHSAIELLRSVTEESGASLIVVTHDERVRGRLDAEFDLVGAP